MSDTNLVCNRSKLYIRSTRYCLSIDRIPELVPRWVIALSVAFALIGPIIKFSVNIFAVTVVCMSAETSVFLGTKFIVLSFIDKYDTLPLDIVDTFTLDIIVSRKRVRLGVNSFR